MGARRGEARGARMLSAPSLLPLLALAALDLRIAGSVRLAGGAPASRAGVWLSTDRGWQGECEVLAHGETDEAGRFALALPKAWIAEQRWRQLVVWAWRSDATLGVSEFDAQDVPAGRELELRLGEPLAQTLRLLDADGAPLAGARVTPRRLRSADHWSAPPDELAEALAATSAADGTLAIGYAPLSELVRLRAESARCGLQELQGEAGPFADGEWTLAPVGELAIEVEGEAPASLRGGVAQLQTLFYPAGTDDQIARQIGYGRARLALAADGESEPVRLAAGMVLLSLPALPADERLRSVVFPARTESGKTTALRVVWREGVRVRGRVVDAQDAGAVAGARILWRQHPAIESELVTAGDGSFEVYGVPGSAQIAGLDAPPPFVGLLEFEGPGFAIPKDVQEFVLPPIELARGVSVAGRVVDPRAAPASDAWVSARYELEGPRGRRSRTVTAVCDATGGFVLECVDPEAFLELSARLGDAVTSAPVTRGASASEPLVLTLTDERRVGLRGRVTDESGRALAGAEVEIWRASPPNVIGGEERSSPGGRAKLTTDADGRFETPRELAPDADYCAVVRAPGRVATQTSWARAGTPVEVALPPLAKLEGVLLDERGEPVAGARVFVAGDAPQPVETTTTVAGRFTLDGVLPGPVFVFAERPGQALAVQRIDPVGETFTWTLAPSAREAPPFRTLAPALARAEELALAARLIAPALQAARAGADERIYFRLLERAARVDPALALEEATSARLGASRADIVRLRAVEGLASSHPEEAQLVAALCTSAYDRTWGTLQIAAELEASAPARALDDLAEALVLARDVESPPHRLVLVTQAAEGLFRLGRDERARELLEQHRSLAEQLAAEEWSGFARGRFAESLARVDFAAATKLVEGLADADDRSRHWGNIAHKLAAREPAQAEEALGRMKGYVFSAERWSARVSHAMARTDSARARRLIESHTRGNERAFALGRMALALAETEPALGRELLAEAWRVLESLPRGSSRDVGELLRAPHVAATLLPAAEAIDPALVREHLCRALALRHPRPFVERPGYDLLVAKSDAQLALLVARYDRALARELLEPVVATVAARGLEERDVRDWRALFAAVALADPDWVAPVADRLGQQDVRATAAEVLSRPPEGRWSFIEDEYLNLWVVGKEDL